jgi:hypothetical protein
LHKLKNKLGQTDPKKIIKKTRNLKIK